MDKAQLRQQMIAARKALGSEERATRSRMAQKALLEAEEWTRAACVLLYLPVRGEVETGLLAETALDQGKRLLLPRVEKAAHRLWLHVWSGAVDELIAGAYGISEPRPDLARVEPAEVDLVVVPGVAFDRHGNRLGYGGGYYDRALPGMERALKVGLGFAFQVVEGLPAEAHDVRLDGLATDEGMDRVARGSECG